MTAWAVLKVLGVGIAVLLLAWTLLLFAPFRWRPVGLYLWFEKVAAGAFTPFIAAAGLLLALVGVLRSSWWLAAPAALAVVGAAIVVRGWAWCGPTWPPPSAPTGPTASQPASRQDGGPLVARAAA